MNYEFFMYFSFTFNGYSFVNIDKYELSINKLLIKKVLTSLFQYGIIRHTQERDNEPTEYRKEDFI